MLNPMKESWSYFDYMRRWWWLLLLVSTIGFVVGLVYSNIQVYPVAFDAPAPVTIEDPKSSRDSPPSVTVSIQTRGAKDAMEAIDYAGSMIRKIGQHTESPVSIGELRVDRNVERGGWWKPPILGTVLGLLLAIGGIYVLEDALSYNRDRLKVRQPGFYTNGRPEPSPMALPNANAADNIRNASAAKSGIAEEKFALSYQRAR